jgi:hypothetical protein
MIAPDSKMTIGRTFLIVLAFVGFAFSLTIHFLALSERIPSSEFWLVAAFVGSLVTFVLAAVLSGAKPGRMGMIPQSEVTKGCAQWLKRTDWFFFGYAGLVLVWTAIRSLGGFHWRKVELSDMASFLTFSAFSMTFYISSVSMLFGRLFGENNQSTPSSDGTQETT